MGRQVKKCVWGADGGRRVGQVGWEDRVGRQGVAWSWKPVMEALHLLVDQEAADERPKQDWVATLKAPRMAYAG